MTTRNRRINQPLYLRQKFITWFWIRQTHISTAFLMSEVVAATTMHYANRHVQKVQSGFLTQILFQRSLGKDIATFFYTIR